MHKEKGGVECGEEAHILDASWCCEVWVYGANSSGATFRFLAIGACFHVGTENQTSRRAGGTYSTPPSSELTSASVRKWFNVQDVPSDRRELRSPRQRFARLGRRL